MWLYRGFYAVEEKKSLDYATKLDLEKSDHRLNSRISDEVRKINEKMNDNQVDTNERLGKLESSLDLNNRETRTLNSSVRDLNGSVKELSTIIRQRDIDVIKLQHRMDVNEDTLGRIESETSAKKTDMLKLVTTIITVVAGSGGIISVLAPLIIK